MRKILITLGIVIVFVIAILATWIFEGRQVSLLVDRFVTIEMTSARIHSITYNGRGAGGTLLVNDLGLRPKVRNDPVPSIGMKKKCKIVLSRPRTCFDPWTVVYWDLKPATR